MNEDLHRAFAFVANGDMGGARSAASRYGLAVFDQELPLRYDSNYLLIDELPSAVSPDDPGPGRPGAWTAPRSWCATSGRASGWFPTSSSWAGSSIAAW